MKMTKDHSHVILFSMKKTIITSISLFALTSMLLSGCGESRLPVVDDYTVKKDTTSEGITIGSDFASFAEAYSEYPIQILSSDGSYQSYSLPSPEEASSISEDMTLMTSFFFIDGIAVPTSQLKEEIGITSSELNEYLRSSEYLNSHEVIFRYILFEFDDGKVSDIEADYLNYNTELY